MPNITLDLGTNSYPIIIEANILATPCLKPYIKGDKVLIVTNEVVAPLYLKQLYQQLQDYTVTEYILADGEQHKTLASFTAICDKLILEKHNRDTSIIALGGGVVGDLTGFTAACYQRGVNFIQIPTTLLAQVDAAVGGKTAVNHPLGKNMIGAFYQPQAVIIDLNTLNSLPDKQLHSGLAEVIKYALIVDYDFFVWLEENMHLLLQRNRDALSYAITKSCQIKAKIVALDEKESGSRMLLNLGHTLGHAIEAAQNYTGLFHGEAVAIGIVFAAQLSVAQNYLTVHDLQRIITLLQSAQLKTRLQDLELDTQELIRLMQMDKKVSTNKIRWILLQGLGKSTISSDIETPTIRQTLANFI